MFIKRHLVLLFCFLGTAALAAGATWDVTVLPSASIGFRGEGQATPQTRGYLDHYDGASSPVFRLEFSQTPDPGGYWSAVLWHTGIFGGGHYGLEKVPDNRTGGLYQQDKLNVGFDNLFLVYHHAVAGLPIEFQAQASVVRLIFHRKHFIVQGQDEGNKDDVSQESAEGFGFGLSGTHGGRYYLQWRANANYLIQLYDSLTDSGAGSIFQGEGGVGMRVTPRLSVELGALRQYWFLWAQGDRRIEYPGTEGNAISWNRMETTAGGYYLRVRYGW